MGGLRARLALTIVALVALTAVVLGVGAYAFVGQSLRDGMREEAESRARFNLSVLWGQAGLAPTVDLATFERSTLPRSLEIRSRNEGGTIVRFDQPNDEFREPSTLTVPIPAGLDELVDSGQLAWAWTVAPDGHPMLLVGGRPAGGGPTFYFVTDGSSIEDALGTLRLGLAGGALVLIALAALAAGIVSRGILLPVDAAARTARRIEAGDLTARIGLGRRDELGRLTASIDAMAETLEGTIARLETAQAQNRRFVADVAHELRTPLTALVAEASLLGDQIHALPRDARRPAELLVTDIRRLRDLVEDLMELSRFDAQAEAIIPQEVDLVRLVRATIASRLPSAEIRTPDPGLIVETDPRRLDRILGNLLDNARQHAPGAPVQVALDREGDGVLIEVADRGPGVPADQLERLFDRFAKVDPSRPGGSGLGLAIAAEHAALLGGTLTARQRDGGGLSFELWLPVTERLPPGAGSDTLEDEPVGTWQPAPRGPS
jgi:two-component system sensor histidine kinase MtrB